MSVCLSFVDHFLYCFAPLQKKMLVTLCIRSYPTGNQSLVSRNSQSLSDVQATSFLKFQITL